MTNVEVLEVVIKKATANGWEPFDFGKPTSIQQWQDKNMVDIAVVFPLHEDSVSWVRELEGIIFNHDFARALWGVSRLKGGDEVGIAYGMLAEPWQYHLQQMVVADDPVQYLREYAL